MLINTVFYNAAIFNLNKKSNLQYARVIALKRVTSGGAYLRGLAPGHWATQYRGKRAAMRTVGDCARFNRPGN